MIKKMLYRIGLNVLVLLSIIAAPALASNVHCFLINCTQAAQGNVVINSTVLHTNSTVGWLVWTNTALGGVLGFTLAIVLYLIFLGALSLRVDFITAGVVASLFSTGLSLLLLDIGPGIGASPIVSDTLPFLFGGSLLLFIILAWARGSTKPY